MSEINLDPITTPFGDRFFNKKVKPIMDRFYSRYEVYIDFETDKIVLDFSSETERNDFLQKKWIEYFTEESNTDVEIDETESESEYDYEEKEEDYIKPYKTPGIVKPKKNSGISDPWQDVKYEKILLDKMRRAKDSYSASRKAAQRVEVVDLPINSIDDSIDSLKARIHGLKK